MTEEQMRQWIDTASYTDLLRQWRFAKVGDPMFRNEAGQHFTETMQRHRAEVGEAGHVAASKAVGWERS